MTYSSDMPILRHWNVVLSRVFSGIFARKGGYVILGGWYTMKPKATTLNQCILQNRPLHTIIVYLPTLLPEICALGFHSVTYNSNQ